MHAARSHLLGGHQWSPKPTRGRRSNLQARCQADQGGPASVRKRATLAAFLSTAVVGASAQTATASQEVVQASGNSRRSHLSVGQGGDLRFREDEEEEEEDSEDAVEERAPDRRGGGYEYESNSDDDTGEKVKVLLGRIFPLPNWWGGSSSQAQQEKKLERIGV